MWNLTLFSKSLPVLNKKDNTSGSKVSQPYSFYSKKLGMASEPLLLSADSECEVSEVPEVKELDASRNHCEQASSYTCPSHYLVDKENGTGSADFCFFCSQQGPVIQESSCDDRMGEMKFKSQSLQMLNSFCSNSANEESQLLPGDKNHNFETVRKCNSVSVIESVGVTTKPCKKSVRDPSISSSLSKVTDLRESSGLMCRICHGGSEDEELIRPCKCTGTVKYAHQSCILNWVSKSGHQSCELCKFKFKTRKESVKCFWRWSFPEVSTKGWLHIGLFIAFATMLLTSVTWIIWSRVSTTPSAIAERTTEEVKFAYMVNGLFIALAVGGLYFDSLKHFKQYSKRWAALNQNVVVECYTTENTSGVRGVNVPLLQRARPQQSSNSPAEEETERGQTSSNASASRNDSEAWV